MTAGIVPKGRPSLEEVTARAPRTAPGIMHHDHQRLQVAEKELISLHNKLADVQRGLVQISDLHEVQGRKRRLASEDFDQLKANLTLNPLVNPIVVRARKEGGYEIVSGHNRVQVYRELGRTEIEAQIRTFKEEEIFEASFYSNLISSPLTDFEKYLGFQKIQEATGETQLELANRAGVSEVQIFRIFSFAQLPADAQKILEKKPSVLGANSALKMKSFEGDKVTDAIRKLVNKEFATEKDALASLNSKPQKLETEVVEIRAGKRVFAKVSHRASIVAIDFKGKDVNANFKAELNELIKKYSMG